MNGMILDNKIIKVREKITIITIIKVKKYQINLII